MPLFDLRCNPCGAVLRDQLFKSRKEAETARHDLCGELMQVVLMPASIAVKGYNAKNGYSSKESADE